MAKEYNPLKHSIVQVLKRDPIQRYECSEFVEALIRYIKWRLNFAVINVERVELDDYHDWEFLKIPGFEYRRYCLDDHEECQKEDHSDCPTMRPNMKFGEVTINWYKYVGSGMSTNVDYDEKQ